MNLRFTVFWLSAAFFFQLCLAADNPSSPNPSPAPSMRRFSPDSERTLNLSEIYMRDVCIFPDESTKTYYMVGPGRNSVRVYTGKDLKTWQGPKTIFKTPEDIWGDIEVVGIWAPEMHKYNGKYYLFLTFDTTDLLCEQWRNWLPRVTRGSQILVSDKPVGPFVPFSDHSALPVDMMTLDGTLWVEDGVPYIVYCHEWVQITVGTVEYMQLSPDLSKTVGEPVHLFDGSDAKWSKQSDTYHGCHVTDGPYLYTGKTGKLYMIWSSHGNGGYTCGIAISDSGKLAGPWRHQETPLYSQDGGHGMLFTTFDGKLMMVLHSPNNIAAQPHIFELQDTGQTLEVIKEFTGDKDIPAVEPKMLSLTGDLDAHDPVIIRQDDTYYVFTTGGRRQFGMVPIKTSKDLHHFRRAGFALKRLPDWAPVEIPGTRDTWAPDISYFNGLYHLYYSVSTFGKNNSAIGLAVNKTLDPESDDYEWTDRGMVVRSTAGKDDFNAIDANIAIVDKDNIYLSWGSFWGGIKMRKIDPLTGMLSTDDTTLYSLACRPRYKEHVTPPVEGAVEAPFIFRHGDYWYLFVSFDFCCRGADSTYHIVVGRSKSITGPYTDKEGKLMTEGGGTVLLEATAEGNWKGPGHNAVFMDDDGTDYIVFHAYDGQTGRPELKIASLFWDDGWPVAPKLP